MPKEKTAFKFCTSKPVKLLIDQLSQITTFHKVFILYVGTASDLPFQHRHLLVVPFASELEISNYVAMLLNPPLLVFPPVSPIELLASLKPDNREWLDMDVPLIVTWMKDHSATLEDFHRIPFKQMGICESFIKK